MEVVNGNPQPIQESKRIIAGVLGILLGGLGIHKFVLGYTTQGIIMLLISVIGGILIFPAAIVGLVGFIEGIIYLTKSDEEFVQIYQVGEKPWF
jgi:TM2 domain-containing membrane protein YozV